MALYTSQFSRSALYGGLNLAESLSSIAGDFALTAKLTTNPGYAGSLTTRTTASSGTITTVGTGVISTGQTIDIFWTNADGSMGCLANCIAGTVSGTSVPFTGVNSSGQVLPSSATSVFVCPIVYQVFNFVGSSCVAENAFTPTGPVAVSFMVNPTGTTTTTSSPETSMNVGFLVLINSGILWGWQFNRDQATNPLAGLTVQGVQISTGQANSVQNVQVAVLSN